jgi:hypothetical protein
MQMSALRFSVFVVLLLPLVAFGCGPAKQPPSESTSSLLSGPYMGQDPPGLTPSKFLGDVLEHNFCSVFSPDGDEFYFTHYDPDSGACSIEMMKQTEGVWGSPETAPFSSEFTDNDIAISSDGNRVVFRSNRPLPNDDSGEKRDGLYLWTSTRTDEGWGGAEVVTYDGRIDIPGGYPASTSSTIPPIPGTGDSPGSAPPRLSC